MTKGTMKIELKRLRVYPELSEETTAFNATVCIDGAECMRASNNGHGGANQYRPLGSSELNAALCRDAQARIRDHAASLPPIQAFGYPLQPDIDIVIGDLMLAGWRAKVAPPPAEIGPGLPNAEGVNAKDITANRVSHLAREALQTDGAHHKQWFLAMILKEVDPAAHYDCEKWGVDTGTAP